MRQASRRWWRWGVVLLVVAVAVAVAWQLALREFQRAVLEGLGPRASVAAWDIGLSGIALHGLRIRAERSGPGGWPADDELRAARVHLEPAWRSLWAGDGDGEGWQLRRVSIEGAYLSVLRPRQGGLRLLPALLARPVPAGAAAPAASAPARAGPRRVHIAEIVVRNATLDAYDASVGRVPHRLQVSGLEATLGPIAWPALDQPVPLAITGRLQGLAAAGDRRDGDLRIDGTLTPAARDAQLKVRLRGIDLRVLQPYLLRVNEGGVERGFVDLDLDATVRGQRLKAPGRVVFSGLQLAAPPGLLGSFAGLPQQLVLAAVRERGRIELKFTLDGRLDDPAFALNENLATRIGVGLAQSLGVSVGGVVEGLGQVIKGLFGK